MSNSSPLIRPVPLRSTHRRSFQLAWAPDSAESSAPGTPFREIGDPTRLSLDAIEDKASKRTSSILNLTSSTLFGIFSPSGYDSVREVPSTPWGTGAETPSQQPHGAVNRPILLPKADHFSHTKASEHSFQGHSRSRSDILPLLRRAIWLFVFGVAYGLIITILHDHQGLAPVRVENIDHRSWPYLIVWGATGVCLGGLLPWMDFLWEEAFGVGRGPQTSTAQLEPSMSRTAVDGDDERAISLSTTRLGVDWNSVVRSIGAFVGIAFAIRKLPWQSTLQASLTLALVNPVLWYLIDRSKPGFALSSFVGIIGTAILFGVNPAIVPSPAASLVSGNAGNSSVEKTMYDGLISNESVGVWTWVASVLFCSSICFGNIGRKLALSRSELQNVSG